MKRIAVYPGSFDPITKGHLDIIKRSSEMFDKLVIGVLNNAAKKNWFSVEDRIEMIKAVVNENDKIEIAAFSGLLVDFMKMKEANVIIRGLRAVSDYEYELQLALTNSILSGNTVETIFLPASREGLYLSSSVVKEVAILDGDLSGFVDEKIEKIIKNKVIESRRGKL